MAAGSAFSRSPGVDKSGGFCQHPKAKNVLFAPAIYSFRVNASEGAF